jgi:hypothetical protein
VFKQFADCLLGCNPTFEPADGHAHGPVVQGAQVFQAQSAATLPQVKGQFPAPVTVWVAKGLPKFKSGSHLKHLFFRPLAARHRTPRTLVYHRHILEFPSQGTPTDSRAYARSRLMREIQGKESSYFLDREAVEVPKQNAPAC